MDKALKDLMAALEAEKKNTQHLAVAKELVNQLAARLALHATEVGTPQKAS
jgi:hypothetical protein